MFKLHTPTSLENIMNLLSEVSKAIARISTKEDFITGMDFFINRLELIPYGHMTRDQLEALYLCSNEKFEDRNQAKYELYNDPYLNLEKVKTSEIWSKVLEVFREHAITFNDVIKFSGKDIQLIIRSVSIEVLQHALTGAPEIIKEHFFCNMTEGMASMIKRDIEEEKNISQKIIDDARNQIVESIIYFSEHSMIDVEEDTFITKPSKKAAYKLIDLPEKCMDEFLFIFTKTGISPELREKLISNGKDFFSSEENRNLFESKFKELIEFCRIAEREGILSLECQIEGSDEFTSLGLQLLCDATEAHIIDEILSAKIIQDCNIDSQFLKFLTLRTILYIQCNIPVYTVAQNLFSLIPDEFSDFKNKIKDGFNGFQY